jgi:hypothetical protein
MNQFNTLVETILNDPQRHHDYVHGYVYPQIIKDIQRAEALLDSVKERAESKHADKPFKDQDLPEVTEDQVEALLHHTFPKSAHPDIAEISLPKVQDALGRLHELAGEICFYRAMYKR